MHEQLVKWNYGGVDGWQRVAASAHCGSDGDQAVGPALRVSDAEPMVVCDLDGNVVDGSESPSSDTTSHAYIYRHMPDVYGVVHTHSTYATACGDDQNISCGLTMMGDEFGGPVPVGRSV